MKKCAELFILAGGISFLAGSLARAMTQPMWGIPAHSFIVFTTTCLIFAITLILLAMLNNQEKK